MIDRLVDAGRYASASEVVRDGLRLLQEREEARLLEKWLLEGLSPEEQKALPAQILADAQAVVRERIREGLAQARRGELVDGHAFFDRWKARLDSAAGSAPKKPRTRRRK